MTPSFPAIRACIFDLDGLLINTEDIITTSINRLLAKYGRPPMTRAIRAQLMGVANSSNGDAFHGWARLPISREQWARESKEEFRRNFPNCAPLPGAETLIITLSRAFSSFSAARPTTPSTGEGAGAKESKQTIKLALASGTTAQNYALKTSLSPETQKLLSFFPPEHRVLGDGPRLPAKGSGGRGKPAPDIYQVALQTLNATAEASGEEPILPSECLVFEDSVVGVEAGRRAGMRVVWVPHPDMAAEYRGREEGVLAGRTGMVEMGDGEERLGEVDDGWAEMIRSLEHFDYAKFGIHVGV
ncbi:haloacid dehalogenase-like hydrolase [Apiospora aurea]|uniref:Haloacid dehalogenase-like hydrolase n=1 Tax=Apiospora aurea TaxID=335848 RepID=A0ABR1QG37_9PEZI